MLGDNFTISLDKNGAVNNVRNFGVPETFAWKGDKKQDGAHIPIYTYAELEKEYVPTTRIQDVYDHWSRYYVLKLEEEKVLEGMEQFEPDIPVTKECFVNWLVKASNAEIHEYNGCFADVRPDDSNADYIQTAYDLGFIHGDNGNFYPGHNLSREEMAEIMNNILKYKGVETMSLKKSFQDIDQVSDWAKAAVENCLAAGILSGNEAFEFNPQNTFSRAEAATVTAKTFCGAY